MNVYIGDHGYPGPRGDRGQKGYNIKLYIAKNYYHSMIYLGDKGDTGDRGPRGLIGL